MADQQYNFKAVIPWHILEKYLYDRLKQVDHKLRYAKADDILIEQGRSQVLEELIHLPDTLTILYSKLDEDGGLPNV